METVFIGQKGPEDLDMTFGSSYKEFKYFVLQRLQNTPHTNIKLIELSQ